MQHARTAQHASLVVDRLGKLVFLNSGEKTAQRFQHPGLSNRFKADLEPNELLTHHHINVLLDFLVDGEHDSLPGCDSCDSWRDALCGAGGHPPDSDVSANRLNHYPELRRSDHAL